jgi:hypothetical protein
LGNAGSRRVCISFDLIEIDPLEWQVLRFFNTNALAGNTPIVKHGKAGSTAAWRRSAR